MRRIALPLVLFLPGLAAAQPPAPNAAQMLDTTLGNWEQAMARLDCFSVTCRRTSTDKVFGTVETYAGAALFRKGTAGLPTQARLRLTSTANKQQYEEFLNTGPRLYVWLPATKVLQVRQVPPRNPGQPLIDDNIVALLFGVTAAAARDRYEMQWLPDPKKDYHYIRILPRRAADKAEFAEAQLSLTATDYLPRQLRYFQPNGNVVQWDFENLRKNAAASITDANFAPPTTLPQGWRVESMTPMSRAPAAAPKR